MAGIEEESAQHMAAVEDGVVEAAGERRSGSKARWIRLALVAMGVALIGGVATLNIDGLQGASADARPPYSAAMVAVSPAQPGERAVVGDAWLDEKNRLEWWLDFLPANSKGLVQMHSAKSCDDIGDLHWDGSVDVGPWEALSWSSNRWGESFGRVSLGELAGTYSFPANIERALVVYSDAGVPLACGVLEPEPDYVDFGVIAIIRKGFNPHRKFKTAGEVILSKSNNMTWALYNLEANATGALRIFEDDHCDALAPTCFETEWDSDEWGIASGSVLVNASSVAPFYELVDRAVGVFNTSDHMVGCDKLSRFAHSIQYEIDEALFELSDIKAALAGEPDPSETEAPTHFPSVPPTRFPTSSPSVPGSLVPTAPGATIAPTLIESPRVFVAAVSEIPTTEALCEEAGTQNVDVQAIFENNQDELDTRAEEFEAAAAAILAGVATPEQVEANARQQFLAAEQAALLDSQTRITQFFEQNCLPGTCDALAAAIEENAQLAAEAQLELSMLEAAYNDALAIPAANRTAAQEEVIEEYTNLSSSASQYAQASAAASSTYAAECPLYSTCLAGNPIETMDGCSVFICSNRKLDIGRLAFDLVAIRKILFERRVEFAAAEAAIEVDAATPEQEAVYAIYLELIGNRVSALGAFRSAQEALREDPMCSIPSGEVSLDENRLFRWDLVDVQPGSTGVIRIQQGPNCAALGEVLNVGTIGDSNTTGVVWAALPAATASTGSADLGLLATNPSFANLTASTFAVVYNDFAQQVACGPFTPAEA